MIPIVLALSTTCVVAFNNVNLLKNGNAEERFSFDGHFDRIEHGGYGHKSHKGTKGASDISGHHHLMRELSSKVIYLIIVDVNINN